MLLFWSSLYDNWINFGSFGVKPFDMVFIIISIFNFSRNSFKIKIDKWDRILIFFLLVYFVLSLINTPDQIIRNLYILLIFPYGFLVGKSLKKNYVYKILTFTIGLWLFSFIFQYISFYLFGSAPDLLIFSTQVSRIDNVETFIGPRFSGLSVEPYQYTYTVSFLSIALITQKYNFREKFFDKLNVRDLTLFLTSLITTFLSGSFFAYVNLFFCILIFLPYISKTLFKTKIKIFPLAFMVIFSISLSIFISSKSNIILQRIASEALVNQEQVMVELNPKSSLNRSFYDRTARLFSAQCRNYVFDQTILIGDGLDTINYHPKCGMNLVSFIVVNFGFLGSLVLYFTLFRRLDNLAKWWLLFTSFFVYPLVGSIFLPFVLGCLMKKETNSDERQNKTLST